MPVGAIAAGGAVLGGLSGALGGSKSNNQDAGNAYAMDPNSIQALNSSMKGDAMGQGSYQGNAGADVASNPLTSGLYGQGGIQDQAQGQLSNLYSNPGLTNDDKTAYGQAAGNIARQFGESDQGLSQSLADRGLSNSNVAQNAFSNSQGNKNEQLAGLQTQIAQRREQLNQQKMQSLQQFTFQLGNQANTDMNSSESRGIDEINNQNQAYKNNFDMANKMLGNYQTQQNQAFNQSHEASNNQGGGMGGAINGAIGGATSGLRLSSAMSGGGEDGMSNNTPVQEPQLNSYFSGKNPFK